MICMLSEVVKWGWLQNVYLGMLRQVNESVGRFAACRVNWAA